MEPDTTEIEKQRQYYLAFMKSMQKQETAQKELQDSARKTILKELEEKQSKTAAMQALCPHYKPNGMTAIAGQKIGLFGNKHIFVCQCCNREWDKEEDIPLHLRPANSMIGFVNSVTFHEPRDEATTRAYLKVQDEEEEYQSTRPVYNIEKDMAWALWYQRQNWFVRWLLHPKLQYLAKRYNHGEFVEPGYRNLYQPYNFRQRIRIQLS